MCTVYIHHSDSWYWMYFLSFQMPHGILFVLWNTSTINKDHVQQERFLSYQINHYLKGSTCYSSTTSGSLIQIHLHESVCVRLFRSCYSKSWTHFQIVSGLSWWHEWCHHTGKSLVFHWGSCSINKCYTTLMREVKWGLAEAPPAATSHSFIFNEAVVAVLIHPFWLLSEGDVVPSLHLQGGRVTQC